MARKWILAVAAFAGAGGSGQAAMAEAGQAAEPSCEAAKPARRTRRTKDGALYVFDEETCAWRQAEPPRRSPADAADHGQVQQALPWSQFDVSFDGDVLISGRPLLLGAHRSLRHGDAQQHGDTARSVWDGATALAKLLDRTPQLVSGRVVLEVGAGRGVVGAAAAMAGAARTVMTDLPYALEQMAETCALTFREEDAAAGSTPEVAELDWTNPAAFLDGRPEAEAFDVVLAADVVWLIELVEPLVEALGAICTRSPGADVLVVHQTRSSSVDVAFLELMAARGFAVSWELPGGPDGNATTVKGAAEARPDEVTWGEGFLPDSRVRLWCFRLEPTTAAANEL